MISQLIIGFMLESIMGPFRIGLLYIVSGIGGIAFSCLCSLGDSVGASTAIFGLFGGLVLFFI
jgi:rhomboid protease GluP